MKELFYLNKYLVKYWKYLIPGMLFVIISNLFAVFYPQIIRQSVDLIAESVSIYPLFSSSFIENIYSDSVISSLIFFALILLLVTVLRGVFMYFMRQTIIVMSRWIEFDLKNEIFEHYLKLPISFYKRNNTGDLMARISEDVGKVRMYVGPGIMYTTNLIALFVLVIHAMLQVNVRLSMFVLLPLPLLAVAIFFVNKKILERSTLIQNKLGELTSFSQENYSGIRVLKSFNRLNKFSKIFEGHLDDYYNKSMSLVKVDALFFPLIMSLVGLSTILTIYIGGLEVIAGNLTPGNIAEFVIYVNMLTWPVASLGWVVSINQQAIASQKRILEVLNEKPTIEKEGGLKRKIEGKIEFKNVSFTYPENGISALKNMSFTINANETLGIVGETASGKSTIASLICRLYDVNQGQILIDGIDIKEYDITDLRKQIGVVPQEVFLFSDSIQNNIAYSEQANDFSEMEIENYSKKAALHDNVIGFPKQYQTVLGERGLTISGGQKQRVSIARALASSPKMLIFDDCLSALDTDTEKVILDNLYQEGNNKSMMIISHRITSVINADNIIMINGGEIVEKGSHFELMEKKSFYYQLFKKQQLKSA